MLTKENQRYIAQIDARYPIEELYGNDCFFGMYDLGANDTRDTKRLDVFKAAEFINRVIETVREAETEYPKVKEGRRMVVTHLRLERNPKIAWQCKVRDKFRCQVCDFRFEERYGSLGRQFAEAHHIVALSSLKRPKANDPNDLNRLLELPQNAAQNGREGRGLGKIEEDGEANSAFSLTGGTVSLQNENFDRIEGEFRIEAALKISGLAEPCCSPENRK